MIGSYFCPFDRRVQTGPCKVCDTELTRPREHVMRRVTVTLLASVALNVDWDPDFLDPNSDAYIDTLATLSGVLPDNAIVTGLALHPPTGRSSRDVYIHPECEADPSSCEVSADVEVTAEAEVETDGDEATEEDVEEIGTVL